MRRIPGAAAAFAAGALLLGCRPESIQYYEETDAVLTIREPGRDFSGLSTFGLWEEVLDLGDLVDDPIDIDHERIDPVLLGAVEDNMVALGWTMVDDPVADDPDVVLVIGTVATNNWYFYYYPCWDPYWCYYPPVGSVVNFPVGSVIITMVKPDEATDEDGETVVPAIWAAGIQGELGSSSDLARFTDGIDQAFVQSPYLEVAP